MSETQTIFRVCREHRDKWTPLLNQTIRDERLSFRATGLLVYLLSLPSDWQVNQGNIARAKTEGRDAVVTAFNELREFGYITKELMRDDGGKIIGTIWNVFESPDHRLTGKPETVDPEPAEPFTVNPPLQRKEGEKPQKERKTATSIKSKMTFPEAIDTTFFEKAWDKWYAYRRSAKLKAYTPQGAKAQLTILAEIGPERAIAAIEHSIAQGYQGIYEPKNTAKTSASNGRSRNAGTHNEGKAGNYADFERLAPVGPVE